MITDFNIVHSDGTIEFSQAKVGYKSSGINWSRYEGQKIIIDKRNKTLINRAKKTGFNVRESQVASPDTLPKRMQLEAKLTWQKNAPIVSNICSTGKVLH